ncbi:MAG: hypothetical protein FWH21_09640 [Kiritimatiellaeota bacterium]|nr:hypothetical protein [Kiritimatiellota bacterium]
MPNGIHGYALCPLPSPCGCDWSTNGMVLGEADLERYGLAATNMLLSIAAAHPRTVVPLISTRSMAYRDFF